MHVRHDALPHLGSDLIARISMHVDMDFDSNALDLDVSGFRIGLRYAVARAGPQAIRLQIEQVFPQMFDRLFAELQLPAHRLGLWCSRLY
jgi:hypothetical protein